MINETNNIEKQNESLSTETQLSNERKSYHTPKLLHYGGLAELVQRRSSRAMDGETMFVDCTLT